MANENSVISVLKRVNERIREFYPFLLCFTLALIFCYFAFWQLCVLAGIIAGGFYQKMRKGALQGTLAVGSAWTFFIILEVVSSNVEELINQISGIVIGNTDLGWIFIMIIILLGFSFGALSGAIGSGIRILIESRRREN